MFGFGWWEMQFFIWVSNYLRYRHWTERFCSIKGKLKAYKILTKFATDLSIPLNHMAILWCQDIESWMDCTYKNYSGKTGFFAQLH